MPLELGVAKTSEGVWSQLYVRLGSQGKFAVIVRHLIPAVAFDEGEDALAAGAGSAHAAAPEALFDERFAGGLAAGQRDGHFRLEFPANGGPHGRHRVGVGFDPRAERSGEFFPRRFAASR